MKRARTGRQVVRHDVRKYDTRRSSRWIDRRGETIGRLLCLEWVGRWKGQGYWKCQCDCGRVCIAKWSGDRQSCGCLDRETRRTHTWETLRLDGTWGHVHAKAVVLPDGRRFPSVAALARYVGISPRPMKHRIDHWPPERWLEVPQPRGAGAKKHRRGWMREKAKKRERLRPQPWAKANARRMTELNRRRREGSEDVR